MFQRGRFVVVLQYVLLGWIIIISGCGQDKTENNEAVKSVYKTIPDQVDTLILKRTSFQKEIVSNGKLKALYKSNLNFRVPGELRQLNVKNGDQVEAGQTLGVLDQFEYRQQLEQAETALKKSSIDFEDALLSYGGTKVKRDSVPKAIHDGAATRSGYTAAARELKTAQYNLERTILKAPFDGKVADLKHNKFEQVFPGDKFCTVINDTEFEVEFHLIESEIAEVALNDHVKVIPFAINTVYKGIISAINPRVDENGLVLAKAKIKNNGLLWEGMNVKVLIEKQIPDQLVVPKSAVVLRQNQEVLFKYVNGKALWIYILTSLESSTSYTVTAHPDKGGTLAQGDTIIISNNLNLAHESEVTIRH
jgi:membrane fusion protein, multidrug efflux system